MQRVAGASHAVLGLDSQHESTKNAWGVWSRPASTQSTAGGMTAADRLRRLASNQSIPQCEKQLPQPQQHKAQPQEAQEQSKQVTILHQHQHQQLQQPKPEHKQHESQHEQPHFHAHDNTTTDCCNSAPGTLAENKVRSDSSLSDLSDQSRSFKPGSVKNTKKKTTGPVHNTRYKAKLCKNWMKNGSCPYFEKCQFAHGPYELEKWANRRAKAKVDAPVASGSTPRSETNQYTSEHEGKQHKELCQIESGKNESKHQKNDEGLYFDEMEETKMRGDDLCSPGSLPLKQANNLSCEMLPESAHASLQGLQGMSPSTRLPSPHDDTMLHLGAHLGHLNMSGNAQQLAPGSHLPKNHSFDGNTPSSGDVLFGLPERSSLSQSPFDGGLFEQIGGLNFDDSNNKLFSTNSPTLCHTTSQQQVQHQQEQEQQVQPHHHLHTQPQNSESVVMPPGLNEVHGFPSSFSAFTAPQQRLNPENEAQTSFGLFSSDVDNLFSSVVHHDTNGLVQAQEHLEHHQQQQQPQQQPQQQQQQHHQERNAAVQRHHLPSLQAQDYSPIQPQSQYAAPYTMAHQSSAPYSLHPSQDYTGQQPLLATGETHTMESRDPSYWSYMYQQQQPHY